MEDGSALQQRTSTENAGCASHVGCAAVSQDMYMGTPGSSRVLLFVEMDSLLYGSETWRLTENNKRRVEAIEP